jgi:hypothetical protein
MKESAMQNTITAVLILCVAFVAYLTKRNSDRINMQDGEIAALKSEVEVLKKATANGTIAQQAACAERADLKQRELISQSRSPGSKISVARAVGHFNATLNRCLVRTQTTTEYANGLTMWIFTIADAFDGKEFGVQIIERDHLNDKPETNRVDGCFYVGANGQRQDCKDNPSRFDSNADLLMEGAAKY